jgi:hypothetical protein
MTGSVNSEVITYKSNMTGSVSSEVTTYNSNMHGSVSSELTTYNNNITGSDLMTSVGLYSGSISDIKLRTVSVVSTSPTGSGIPDMHIRLVLPYYSRLSRSFVSCRLKI